MEQNKSALIAQSEVRPPTKIFDYDDMAMQLPLNYENRLKLYRVRVGSAGVSESFDEWTADHAVDRTEALEFMQNLKNRDK